MNGDQVGRNRRCLERFVQNFVGHINCTPRVPLVFVLLDWGIERASF